MIFQDEFYLFLWKKYYLLYMLSLFFKVLLVQPFSNGLKEANKSISFCIIIIDLNLCYVCNGRETCPSWPHSLEAISNLFRSNLRFTTKCVRILNLSRSVIFNRSSSKYMVGPIETVIWVSLGKNSKFEISDLKYNDILIFLIVVTNL